MLNRFISFHSLTLLFLLLHLAACTARSPTFEPIIEYHEVYIPTVCDVSLPVRPKYSEDVLTNNLNIIEYSLLLEQLLFYCTNSPKISTPKE